MQVYVKDSPLLRYLIIERKVYRVKVFLEVVDSSGRIVERGFMRDMKSAKAH